jgi:hypothetical protein
MTLMISYFTVMVLTYTIDGEPLQSKILFPSHRACSDAMIEVHKAVDQHFTGTMTQCSVTDIPSKSIRPKARPAELTK